jgi:hypothetical protein
MRLKPDSRIKNLIAQVRMSEFDRGYDNLVELVLEMAVAQERMERQIFLITEHKNKIKRKVYAPTMGMTMEELNVFCISFVEQELLKEGGLMPHLSRQGMIENLVEFARRLRKAQ